MFAVLHSFLLFSSKLSFVYKEDPRNDVPTRTLALVLEKRVLRLGSAPGFDTPVEVGESPSFDRLRVRRVGSTSARWFEPSPVG